MVLFGCCDDPVSSWGIMFVLCASVSLLLVEKDLHNRDVMRLCAFVFFCVCVFSMWIYCHWGCHIESSVFTCFLWTLSVGVRGCMSPGHRYFRNIFFFINTERIIHVSHPFVTLCKVNDYIFRETFHYPYKNYSSFLCIVWHYKLYCASIPWFIFTK